MKEELKVVVDKRTKLLILTLGTEPIIQIKLDNLKKLINIAEKPAVINNDSDHKKILNFYNVYYKERNKFFNISLSKIPIKKNTKDYKTFKQAVEMAEQLDMPYDHYIRAQINLTQEHKQFPDMGALITQNALNRASRFKERFKTIKSEDVQISQSEIDGVLEFNKKYKKALKNIKDNCATYIEAKYVYELLLAKGINIPAYITDYIKEFNGR